MRSTAWGLVRKDHHLILLDQSKLVALEESCASIYCIGAACV